jgi:hypothetical protein
MCQDDEPGVVERRDHDGYFFFVRLVVAAACKQQERYPEQSFFHFWLFS